MRFLTADELNRLHISGHRAAAPQSYEVELWSSYGVADGESGWSGAALVDGESTLVIYAYFRSTDRRVYLGGRLPLEVVENILAGLRATGRIDLATFAERVRVAQA